MKELCWRLCAGSMLVSIRFLHSASLDTRPLSHRPLFLPAKMPEWDMVATIATPVGLLVRIDYLPK